MENLVASQTPVEEAASSQLSTPQNKPPPCPKKATQNTLYILWSATTNSENTNRFSTQTRNVKFMTYQMVSLMPGRQLKLCVCKVIKVQGPQGQQTQLIRTILGSWRSHNSQLKARNNKPSSIQSCTCYSHYPSNLKSITEDSHTTKREIKQILWKSLTQAESSFFWKTHGIAKAEAVAHVKYTRLDRTDICLPWIQT